MTAYAALLRGINVGGAKRLPMDQLRELLTALGHGDVRTYLQSGNAVFTSDATSAAQLAHELEAAIAARFGFEVRCLLRTGEELREVVERCPFPVGEGSFCRYLAMRKSSLIPTSARMVIPEVPQTRGRASLGGGAKRSASGSWMVGRAAGWPARACA